MKTNGIRTWKTLLAKVLMAAVIISVAIIPGTFAKAATAPSLTKSSRNILIGKSYNLDVNGKAKGSRYVWTTSNKKIATVDQRGIVKGINKGDATITCKATVSGKTYTLTCKVSILRPAAGFWITNKVSVLNVGQVYDLDRKLGPSSSNDKTTWTTSDATIAAPDKSGKFTALKEGTVTLTGTTLSGKTDSVTIKVVGKTGIAANQEELNALLKSGVESITIKTDSAVNLTIPAGDYSKISLVVDAPNADITNNGVFASVEIKQIKASTWHENAVGNHIKVSATKASIVVGPDSKVNIEIASDGKSVVKIENNGVVEEVVVTSETEIEITGDTKVNVPVTVNAPNVKVKSNVPLDLTCNKKCEVTLLAGAEKSSIQAASSDAVPAIKGNVTIDVKVGTGDNATTVSVKGTPIEDSTPGGYFPGGGGNPGGNDNNPTTITFDTAISNITGFSFTSSSNHTTVIDSDLLLLVKGLLTSDIAAATWSQITEESFTVGSQTISVSGTNGNYSKTVTVDGGQYDGRSYTVGVVNIASGTAVTLTNSSNVSVTLTKNTADNSFSVSSSLSIQQAEDSQAADNLLDILETLTVTYSGTTYTVDVPELITIKNYINNQNIKAIAWSAISDETRTYDSQTMHITGTAGEASKTVTFTNGQFAGRTYTVSVTSSSVIVRNSSNVTATMTQGTNNISVALN